MNEKQKIHKAMSSITPEKYMKERIRKAVMCKCRSGDSIRLKSQVSSLLAIAAAAVLVFAGVMIVGLGGLSTASSRPSESRNETDSSVSDSFSALNSSSDEIYDDISIEVKKGYLTDLFKTKDPSCPAAEIASRFTISADKPIYESDLYNISVIGERYVYPYYHIAILIENKNGDSITSISEEVTEYEGVSHNSYALQDGSLHVMMLSFEGGSAGLDRIAGETDTIAKLTINTIWSTNSTVYSSQNINCEIPITIHPCEGSSEPDYTIPVNNAEVTISQPIPPDHHNSATFNISEIDLSDGGIWIHCNFTDKDKENIEDAIRNSGYIGTDPYYINKKYAAIKVKYKDGLSEDLKFSGYNVKASDGDEYGSYIKLDTLNFLLDIDNIVALVIGDTQIILPNLR